jgi:NitT/TauT family transport system substrate-binding protein
LKRSLLFATIMIAGIVTAASPAASAWDYSSILQSLFGGSGSGQAEVIEAPTASLGYLPTAHSLDLVILDKFYAPNLKRLKLNPVKFGSKDDLLQALLDGEITGASLPAALFFQAVEDGSDLQIVAKSHRQGNALIVASRIKSIRNLSGEKIAVPGLASVETVLLYRAFANDTGLRGVHLVEMNPDEMSAALSKGEIAGYVADQYTGAESVLTGQAQWLRRSQDIWKNETCCVLALRRDFIEENPEAVQELVDGFVGSGLFVDRNHDLAISNAFDLIALNKTVMDECFKWGVSYSSLRPIEADLAYLYDSLVRLKALRGTLEIRRTLDGSFISKTYRNREELSACG